MSKVNSEMALLCRVCLTRTKVMHDLSETCENLCDDVNLVVSILEVLQMVVGQKVLHNEQFPWKICPMCVSMLKLSFNFIKQFESSQVILTSIFNEPAVQTESIIPEQRKEPITNIAGVQLVVGDNQYDLKDVVIVDEEPKSENDSYDYRGFLRNLGSEVTASFVRKYDKTEEPGKTEILERVERKNDLPTDQNVDKPEVVVTEVENDITDDKIEENIEADVALVPTINLENKTDPKEVLESDDAFLNSLSTVTDSEIIIQLEEPLLSFEIEDKSHDHTCTNCNKNFSTLKQLNYHRKTAHSDSMFSCELCGHVTKTISGQTHHKRTHYAKKYKCDLCRKLYYSSSALKAHMESHKNNRHHLCNICGKGFNYPNALKYHMRLHTGEKKYVCELCGARFTMPNSLTRHLRTHTGERPYHCQHCTKSFSSLGELKSHEYLHSDYRPLKCKYCTKGFTTNYNLNMHLFSHTGEHQCQICLRTFIEINVLKRHYKNKHRDFVEFDSS